MYFFLENIKKMFGGRFLFFLSTDLNRVALIPLSKSINPEIVHLLKGKKLNMDKKRKIKMNVRFAPDYPLGSSVK